MYPLEISITEFFAAEDVPGSKMILNANGKNILIDCGTEYRENEEKDPLPFEPSSIDYVVFTHGHADHLGAALKLFKPLFETEKLENIPPIYSTVTTARLAKMQLAQTASSVWIYNKMVKGKKDQFGHWIPFKKGLYKYQDVKNVMNQFASFDEKKKGFPYEQPVKINENMTATFYEAGHIPGSAQVLFEIKREGKETATVLTSFDLGRTDYHISDHPVADIPLVRHPEKNFPKKINYIIIEATYGDKVHGSLDDSVRILQEAIKDTSKKQSKLIIPTFSIMRTQMLWTFEYRLREQGKIPKDVPFYSNSPSAFQVAKIMMKNTDEMDEKTRKEFTNPKNNPFINDHLIHLIKADEKN